MTVNIHVQQRGPLFDNANRSLPRETIEKIVARVVEEGDLHLARMLRPRPAGVYLSFRDAKKGQKSTGHYNRMRQAIPSGLKGLITDSGVEYGPWLEGTDRRNSTTRFKGYHSFRKTTQWLNSKRVPKLVEQETRKMVGKLNGV
jgi:hypothetical protein